MKSRSILLITCLVASAILLIVVMYSLIHVTVSHMTLRLMSLSMTPTLRIGDMVVAETGTKVSDIYAAYGTGDIIVFHHPAGTGELVVHRAVARVGDGLKTRGDNNPSNDYWTVFDNELLGKVIEVNSLPTYIFQTFPIWIGIIIVLAVSSIVVYLILGQTEKSRIRRQERLADIPKPPE